VDSAGHVFVSDSGNDRVQEFTTAGRLLAAWGVEGARLGEFSGPRGLGVDCRGDVLVADTENNRVQVFQGAAARGSCAAGAAARLGR
jgi:tripartite motif-containing protein 71